MRTTNTILHELATVQTAVQELYEKHIGICGISDEGVHLSETFFTKLFEDKREIVGRKDFSQRHPFMYYTHFSGTKFFCISENPDLFPIYPVEKLAEELLERWGMSDKPGDLRVIYFNGTYTLENIQSSFVDVGATIIYSFEQYESDESVTLEQAILDHMEVVHNANR